ncbi:MAG: Holliday junction resolvase RuvX [Kosmotogaceae bacterium]
MKKLGVDFGTKRIGLAVSIKSVEMPFETITVDNYKKKIHEIVNTKDIDTIVVGLPVSMSGRYNEISLKAISFALKIFKAVNKPVWLFDERLSTESSRYTAATRKSFNNNKDSLSALNILRRFNPDSTNAHKIVDDFPCWIPDWDDLSNEQLLVYHPDNPEIIFSLGEVVEKLKILTDDPQIFFLLKKKGYSSVSVVEDVDPNEYSSIVLKKENLKNCPDELKKEKQIYTYKICARSSTD